ncbi:glycoside hydrolase family 16 protein [Mycena filopes]|nr:glycoside hydrolase family 16 protein [Mycena filopes]
MLAPILLLSLSVPTTSMASQAYSINDTFVGKDFFTWDWYTSDDPTHGRVDYVNQPTARAMNLSVASATSFVMRADSLSLVHPADRGRKSVRISSPSTYADSVLVLDLWHLPTGLSSWPAFWTVSKAGPWPHGGEIDIIEGVNTNTNNLASLHTTANCNMTQTRTQNGQTVSTQCDASFNYNQGCGVSFVQPNSYGPGFNAHGGGWYAMHRASCGISVWFWSRDNSTVPIEVSQGLATVNPDPSLWGVPDAFFPTSACDYMSHFDSHQIVFDLTFCGDWAGSPSAYGGSGCEDYVDNNPTMFNEAYWEISSLRVYTPDGR